jgi:phosphatidylinositol dimannoside acyltransferase
VESRRSRRGAAIKRSQITFVIYKVVGRCLEILPEALDTWFARKGARLYARVQKAKYVALRSNIDAVIAHKSECNSNEVLDLLTMNGFESYGTYWGESAKLAGLSPRVIANRFVISEGLEHLREAFNDQKGVVIALPHIGSWEWGGAFLNTIGMPMTAIAEQLEPPELFELFRSKRESVGIHIEPLNDNAGKVLLNTLQQGGIVGLVADRDIVGGGIEVDFFGHRVTLPAGPATLALRTGAPLLVAACFQGPKHQHHAVISAPLSSVREGRFREDVERVTQLVARELEHLIRRAPEQWHVLEPRFGAIS